MSTEPTWRVYLREWMTVYTAGCMGTPGEQECWDHFARKYGGRVRDEDRKVVSEAPAWWPVLKLRLPNLKGEFKTEVEAADWWMQMPHAHLVQRGSEQEKELLAYGKKMLNAG